MSKPSYLRLSVITLIVALMVVVFGSVASAEEPATAPRGEAESEEAETLSADVEAGEAIPGQYIVVFKDSVGNAPDLANNLVKAHGGKTLHTYEHALKGFAAKLPEAAVEALKRNPNIDFIEQDQTVVMSDVQYYPTWGLDRIDQRDGRNNRYYYYRKGSGVNAYIIDTGIRRSHNEFGGRAHHGYSAINDGWGSWDCNGHGTHVAGTVGGSTYGVAKGVTLYAVRVLDCNGGGTMSGVIAGVDWVTYNHRKPAVANMSLGGGASSALDNAVQRSINAGVTYAVAAGNSGANACYYSPARVDDAMTVGATTSSDYRASYSNYGRCVDIFAPGSSITSAWHSSDSATNTISGTSMASPHVAGVAALYLETNRGASPATVRNAIYNNATTNRLRNIGYGSPNRLLYSLFTRYTSLDRDTVASAAGSETVAEAATTVATTTAAAS